MYLHCDSNIFTSLLPGQGRFPKKRVETRQQRGKCQQQRWHVSLSAAIVLGFFDKKEKLHLF